MRRRGCRRRLKEEDEREGGGGGGGGWAGERPVFAMELVTLDRVTFSHRAAEKARSLDLRAASFESLKKSSSIVVVLVVVDPPPYRETSPKLL
uniref:Uncharacterized protein n=1 Tax=Vespula pensylvanica TaxID=30213 RepID=A0A834NIU1_VESPE|nr:hypothetical protein H0235_013875 [Vespula pensylvanica]